MAMGDSVPDLELDEIMGKIRAEVERRRDASPAPAPVQGPTSPMADSTTLPGPFETPRLALDAPFAAPKDGTLNFGNLAGYHDAAFIANLYRALLRREPDQTGFAHYLCELRAGRLSKAEIAWGFQHSSEGIAAAIPLTGLLRPFLIGRAFRVPVIGPLAHWVCSIFSLHRKLNHIERIEATIYARETILAQEVSDAFASISGALNSQQTSLQAARATHFASSGELSRLATEQASAREARIAMKKEISKLATNQAAAGEDYTRLAKSLEKSSADARAAYDDLGSRAAKLETAIRPLERSLALPTDDRFYADLEGAFRGTEELIKSRAEAYLPFIVKARAGTPGRPVIDLGCGRGEWLELMKSHDLEGIGVDQNNLFIETLRDKNIAAEKGDLLEFLQGRPKGSAGAVTGIHILEHLSFSYLLDVLAETTRVLAPGGVAIFETPNPANLPVGAHTFYLDPTHLKPIPPALLAFLVERAGLVNTETIEIHPPPKSALPPLGSGLPPEILIHFAHPQDYFVVGWKK